MKRISPYIAASVGVHLALLLFLAGVRLSRRLHPVAPPSIALEVVPAHEAYPPQEPLPEETNAITRAPIRPVPPPDIAELPLLEEVDAPIRASVRVRSDASASPSTVLRERRPSIDEALGRRLPGLPARSDDGPFATDGGGLAERRVSEWAERGLSGQGRRGAFSRSHAGSGGPATVGVSGIPLTGRVLLAASEGAAFYAAYTADNVPAMIAVGGISLTQGTLRQGVGLIARGIRRPGCKPEDLQLDGREIDILERVWAEGEVDVRTLYLGLPAGWTTYALREVLEDLVKRGVLRRSGRGPGSAYTANVERTQVLRAMVAFQVGKGLSPSSRARIVRLAQGGADAQRPSDEPR